MRRLLTLTLVTVLLVVGIALPQATGVSALGHSGSAPAKKVCTTKKVHGKKKKICHVVKAKPTPTPRPRCPDPEGGVCLGVLSAGTYQTVLFDPQLTYTVPDGWANYEDTNGSFLLVPPGYTLAGMNSGTSDYIGVDTSVAAPNGCNPGTAPGVDETVSGIASWIVSNPGLVTPQPQAVSVGGLQGVVLDVRMAKTWTGTCPYSNGMPLVPLITGVGTSSLDHSLIAGLAIRLYLLKGPLGTLAIEIVDVQDAGHLDAYSKIVESFHFKT
jgi:hypothetical protein